MVVHLKFFAGLRDFLPPEPVPYPAEIPGGATVGEILARYRVPLEKPKILLVNGRHATLEQPLADGDTLSVFPPVAGG
ncbi:MAG: MoaD/ThiS family protein [Thermodesulfobacteriota bacterium]|jgi:molybdopterin converting factor small subunit